MNLNLDVVVVIVVQLITAGVFVGVVKSSLSSITERLKRIEDKQDRKDIEISELRERVAVIESTLEMRKQK